MCVPGKFQSREVVGILWNFFVVQLRLDRAEESDPTKQTLCLDGSSTSL